MTTPIPGQNSILIVGASRGIGLGLAQEFAGRGWTVIATARDPASAPALHDVAGVTVEKLDVDDPASIAALQTRLGTTVLDIVFVNAGIKGPLHQDANQATMQEIGGLFLTNVIAPVRLARTLLSRVRDETGVIAFMTSRMGSIGLNDRGDMELYRASKSALNSLAKSFHATLAPRRLTVLSLHPGWVRTDMGGPNAPLDVATSVRGLADVVIARRGTLGHAYLDYTGESLAW